MSEIVGGFIGGAWGCSLIIAYFAGRIHQQAHDHKLERERWDDYFARRAAASERKFIDDVIRDNNDVYRSRS